ncbi:hypothetical protein EV2_033838 [Malus domestica]
MDEPQTQNMKRGRVESEKENRSLYICMVQYVGDHLRYIVHAINFVDFVIMLLGIWPPYMTIIFTTRLDVASSAPKSLLPTAWNPIGYGPFLKAAAGIITDEFIGEKTQPFMVDFNRDDGKNDLYAPSGSPFYLCFPPTFEVLVSSLETHVFCFDVAEKDPERQHWRQLSSMLFNGMDFPFVGTTLVLDLDDSDDEKLMFAYQETDQEHSLWGLAAYRQCMTC